MPDLAGLRDRVLLLVVGFFAALYRSELSALTVDQPNDLVIVLPRSKTNPCGGKDELVVLPRNAPW